MLGSLYRTPSLPINAFGLGFRHPLGLAAGMDKKCEALPLWPSIGFSWIEGGGITYHPQDGNAKPRMFRSDSDRALVNRMGFNNNGAESLVKNFLEQGIEFKKNRENICLGINFGTVSYTHLTLPTIFRV